jgi:hypothetical protein
MCWMLYAPVILFAKFVFPWADYEWWADCVVILLITSALSTIIGTACLVMLELVRQVERGEPTRIGRALSHTMSEDLPRALPVLFVWGLVWALLLIGRAIVQSKSRKPSSSLDPENAAKELLGYRDKYSTSDLFFDGAEEGVRMAVFMILPPIAWEELWPSDAFNRGLHILKAHLATFASGFVLTDLAAGIVFLPATLLIGLSAKAKVPLPDNIWFGLIIYSAFAWSFTFFIEQMFAAQLYLWHIKWLSECKQAYASNRIAPRFEQVPPPEIMRELPWLNKAGGNS